MQCWTGRVCACLQMPFVLGVLDDITLGPYSIMDAEHLHPHIAGETKAVWARVRVACGCPVALSGKSDGHVLEASASNLVDLHEQGRLQFHAQHTHTHCSEDAGCWQEI